MLPVATDPPSAMGAMAASGSASRVPPLPPCATTDASFAAEPDVAPSSSGGALSAAGDGPLESGVPVPPGGFDIAPLPETSFGTPPVPQWSAAAASDDRTAAARAPPEIVATPLLRFSLALFMWVFSTDALSQRMGGGRRAIASGAMTFRHGMIRGRAAGCFSKNFRSGATETEWRLAPAVLKRWRQHVLKRSVWRESLAPSSIPARTTGMSGLVWREKRTSMERHAGIDGSKCGLASRDKRVAPMEVRGSMDRSTHFHGYSPLGTEGHAWIDGSKCTDRSNEG